MYYFVMKFFNRIFFVVAAVVAVFLCGCFGLKYYETVSSHVDDTTWIPIYVLGQEGTEIPSTSAPDREAYLHFAHRGYGRFLINGKAGVNSFSGSMDVRNDDSIIIARSE